MSEFRSHPDPSQVGRLRRLRVDELAEEGPAPLLDHSEHLLQLRVGVRHPRLRRQGERSTSARSRATRCIPAAAAAPARRASSRRTSSRIRIASSIRCGATASAASASGSRCRGTRRSTTSADASARRSSRTGATRSCITSAGPARTATRTACCRRGASTATTATPTSARRRRGSGIFSGAGNDRPSPDYANARDDPAAVVAPRDRATTSTRTRSGSSRASRTARR